LDEEQAFNNKTASNGKHAHHMGLGGEGFNWCMRLSIDATIRSCIMNHPSL
jgi:hypothetical protein